MTARKIKNALYERLRADERFRLAVDAAARNDWDEAGHLSDTCPTYMYKATEIGYLRRVRAAPTMALAAANLLLHAQLSLAAPAFSLELIDKINATTEGLPGTAGDGATLANSAFPAMPDADYRNEIEGLYTERVSVLLAVYEGVERFCSAIGVEPTKLFAVAQCQPVWNLTLGLRDRGLANPATSEAVHECLTMLWSSLVGEEPSSLNPVGRFARSQWARPDYPATHSQGLGGGHATRR